MFRNGKREITKKTSGSPDLPIVRTERAFDLTCYRCGRQSEAREIEIVLPPALGQKNLMWTRIPDGWWLQGSFVLSFTAGCPGCMETPLEVAVAQVARKPEPTCDHCGHPMTPGRPCDVCGPVDGNIPGKHDL